MPQYSGQWWDREKHEFWYQFFIPFVNTVRQRPGPSGRKLNYVTAQTVENRLDDLVGPSNWWDEYQMAGLNCVLCRLSIRTPWGEVVTKSDCGDMEMPDGEVNEKGGFSDSLKRAAVKFGIGRHLYEDGLPLIYEDGVPGESPDLDPAAHHRDPGYVDAKNDGLAPPAVAEKMLAAEQKKMVSVPEATHVVNELIRGKTIPRAFSQMPACGPQFPAWIKEVSDFYGQDALEPAKRVAAKNGKSTNFGELDQADTNRIAFWIINWCKKLKEYSGEFESLGNKLVDTKRNVAWMRACQYFGFKFPNEAPPTHGDSRVKAMISKITHGEVSDVMLCADADKLGIIASIFQSGINGEDILSGE